VQMFLGDRGGCTGNELIVLLAGANDLAWQPPYGVARIPDNITKNIRILAAAGGKTFLVPNLYVLGQSPANRGTSSEVSFDTLAAQINRVLDHELAKLEAELDITVIRFDFAAVVDAMLNSPAVFGLANVTDPACPGCGIGVPAPNAADTMVPNPDEYLWWDLIHMTRVAHAVIGEATAAVVSQVVER